jgi:peptidoglycan hydrolase CwlO-like protein
MSKQVPVLIAALLITTFIGLGMFSIGGNALLNKNTLPIFNSPAAAASDPPASGTVTTSGAEQAQIQQLQGLVNQYQQREKQYQSELTTAQQEIQQANQQLQQYQQLFNTLQQAGLISVGRDGSIFVRQFGDR